ncbi:MAG: radical SAM protein [Elusimicrobiota bacterium]
MFPLKNFKRNLHKFIHQPGYGIKVFLKRLKASFYYKGGEGKAPLPEAVTLFLTKRCNLKCKMCGQWGDKGVTRTGENIQPDMPFKELKKIILSLAEFKPSITLFGGEPLLYSEIDKVIKLIKNEDMHCVMITNGYLLDKYAKVITKEEVDELNISIDGPGEVHDEIRGIKGLYNKIKSGVNAVNNIRTGKKPLINLQTTITKYNMDNLLDMLDVAEDFGADSITFHHLIFLNKKAIENTDSEYPDLGTKDWNGFVFEPGIDPKKLVTKIEKIKREGRKRPFDVNIYPNFSKKEINGYYTSKDYFPDSYSGKCKSSWICAYIFPDGELRPCLNFKYSFGNLKQKKFNDVWNGKKAIKFRKLLTENSRFPVCSRCTEIFRY